MLEQTVHIGHPPMVVALFAVMVVVFLALDLFSHRADKPVTLGNAISWSIVWVALSLCFAGYLYVTYDIPNPDAGFAALFLTGYALEKVLSVDNLMVFVAIFSAFGVPEGYRHRVLFYGVIGAIIFRLIFVAAGSWLYALGPWVEMVFAAIIVWTAIAMLRAKDGEDAIADYSQHWSVRLTQRVFPVWPKLAGHSFFVSGRRAKRLLALPENQGLEVVRGKALYATPLLLCLVTIEMADIMFAFDSVPAVIAVTKEPLLVYSAMIFAILGLRQLYFVLAALQKFLVHLAKAIICLLFFIAFKLALSSAVHMFHLPADWKIEPATSLMIVLATLTVGVLASVFFPPKEEKKE